MFEDLELADYGNRIPSITVEVEADGPVDPHEVAAELGGLAARSSGLVLAGYAVAGGRVSDAVADARALTGAPLREVGRGIALGHAGTVVTLPGRADRVADGDEGVERRAAAELPDAVELGYFDPERDYQAGLQRAGGGVNADALIAAAAMSAGQAAALAGARLERLRAAREVRRVVLPMAWMAITPGQIVSLPDAGGRLLVRASRLERGGVYLELEPVPEVTLRLAAGDGGRVSPAPDVTEGATVLALLDLPVLPRERPGQPRLLVAAAGTGEGWRGATLEASTDGGLSWADGGFASVPAVMGRVAAAPAPAPPWFWDREGAITVELLHDGMWLESRDEASVLGGENLAAVGGELIGFARAEPLGGARWRLSGLLRGRFGTEGRSASTDDPFVLVERDALVDVSFPIGSVNSEARVIATARTGEPVEVRTPVTDEALRPLPPCHLRAEQLLDGAIVLTWTRRSRAGWAWLDGVDAPLGEERELYRVRVGTRMIELSEPRWTYTAVEQVADGAAGPLRFEVMQVGALAVSRAAVVDVAGG